MKKFLILFVFLTGCGQSQNNSVTVEPLLAPYLTSFEKDIGASTSGINVEFADTESYPNPLGETVGECIFTSDSRTIQIDTKYWNTLDENGKIELIYHELGHCALFLQHIPTLDPTGCPTSIMYPMTFGDSSCFTTRGSYYFSELASHK